MAAPPGKSSTATSPSAKTPSANSPIEDESGAVVVEFALALPIMFVFFLGLVSAFDGYRASYRASETASIVADLASRMSQISADNAASLFATADALMGSARARGDLTVQIVSVAHWPNAGEGGCDGRRMERGGCLRVTWSLASRGAFDPDVDDLTLPEIPRGESVIQVFVTFDYNYIFSIAERSVVRLERVVTRRPRFTSEVVYTD